MISVQEIRLTLALELARAHAENGERHVEEQLQQISDLEARAIKPTASHALLDSFKRTLAASLEDLHRIEEETAALRYERMRSLVVPQQ